MKWLVNIAHIVDHQAEGEGLLVTLILEPILKLDEVGRRAGHGVSLQERGQISQCSDNVDIAHLIVWIVINCRASLVQVRLVNEMPVALPAIALTFDIVCKSGAFCERVLVLVRSQRGLGGFQGAQNLESLVQGLLVVRLEDGLSSARHYNMQEIDTIS